MTEAVKAVVAVHIDDAPARVKPSNYPEPFASMMAGRTKRALGDIFGLTSFGVNYVALQPGSMSALNDRHSVQDEFILVVTGQLVLVHDHGETVLTPGMCAGFWHQGTAHHLENRLEVAATYSEIGDRQAGDTLTYPRNDLEAVRDENGWQFNHKTGEPY